jgi:hypothetical protein
MFCSKVFLCCYSPITKTCDHIFLLQNKWDSVEDVGPNFLPILVSEEPLTLQKPNILSFAFKCKHSSFNTIIRFHRKIILNSQSQSNWHTTNALTMRDWTYTCKRTKIAEVLTTEYDQGKSMAQKCTRMGIERWNALETNSQKKRKKCTGKKVGYASKSPL